MTNLENEMTTNQQREKHFAFNEGLPTKPDVDLLLRTWQDMKVGDRFEYETVASLLRIDAASARFKTVTNVWRMRLLDLGFVVECDPGEAFYVAHADQVTAKTYVTIDGIRRKAKRHRTKLAVVKIENETQRSTVEHQGRLMLAIEKDARKHRANLLPSTTAPSVPQIAPPKTA